MRAQRVRTCVVRPTCVRTCVYVRAGERICERVCGCMCVRVCARECARVRARMCLCARATARTEKTNILGGQVTVSIYVDSR